MFRPIEKSDRVSFIKMVTDFYNTAAALHPIPASNAETTFDMIINGSPYVKAYIAECDGETAGYSVVTFTYSNEAGGLVLWIEDLYVLERFRGLGLGGAFLDFIYNEHKDSVRRFRLELMKDNEGAFGLYKRKGFTVLDYMQMFKDHEQ